MDHNFNDYGMPGPQGQRPQDTRPRQMSRQQYVNKRKRRRRAMMLRALAILAIVAVVVGIIVGGILLINSRTSSGVYEREVDVTDRVAADMAIWLTDIDGMEIDSNWVTDRIESYTVTEVLTLSDDNGKTYARTIDQGSYTSLTNKVNEDIGRLLTEIIKDKLVKKGYKDALSDEEAADVARQVLGMSVSDYLVTNGISVVPSAEDIAESVIGSAQSGSYSMHGNEITFQSQDVSETELLIKKKGTLVFTESGRVYNEKE